MTVAKVIASTVSSMVTGNDVASSEDRVAPDT